MFFRLDFGIYLRYTKSFTLEKIPTLMEQRQMIEIYLQKGEAKTLYEKHGLTGFELTNL